MKKIRFKIATIRAAAETRPSGYFDEVMAMATRVDEHTIELTAEARQIIAGKYRNKPAGEWPIWALMVSLWRAEKDQGIGDTIKREVGGTKGERFKRWHEATFGLWAAPCSCSKIRDWNRLYPYAEGPDRTAIQPLLKPGLMGH